MIYDIHTGKANDAPIQRGLVVVDALHAYGDISYAVVSAVGYAEDEHSIAEAKRLFALYKAAPEMLQALEMIAATNPHNAPMTHEQIRNAYAKALFTAKAAYAKAKGEES